MDEFESEQVMREFIECYETLPVLWDTHLAAYKNKKRRREAMESLLIHYKLLKPEINLKDLSKKINSLRVNYRKKLKKVISSKRSGADAKSIYVPISWTFNALQFLDFFSMPVEYEMDSENQESTSALQDESHDDVHHNCEDEPLEDDPNLEKPSASGISGAYSGHSMSSIKSPCLPTTSRKRPASSLAKQNELLSLACKYMKESNDDNSCKKDEFDNIAKVWADKLRKLEPRQRMFAEKAINDVFFEATLQLLQKDSVNINDSRNSADILTQQHLYSPKYSPNSLANNTQNAQSPLQVLQDDEHNYSVATYFRSFKNKN